MSELKHSKIELAAFRCLLSLGQIIVDDYKTLDTILICSGGLKHMDFSSSNKDIDGMIEIYEKQHEAMKEWYKNLKELE